MGLFFIDETKIEYSFTSIAQTLLLNKSLKVNGAEYRFTEIEFYYYCENHKDGYTHVHSMEAGKWHFHNQGFDITLRGETDSV